MIYTWTPKQIVAVLLLTALLFIPTWIVLSRADEAPQKKSPQKINVRAWPMFGGSPQRNMVNLREKNMPVDWCVEEGKEKNVKWKARLGSRAYGGPVISGGKVFVGTNNEIPRDPAVKDDKGILMCFRESDGKFLWQAVHDKLPTGRINDWPRVGIASTPAVEGNRLWYVSNRGELICADTEGFLDGENDGVQDETYKGPATADIVWRLDMRQTLNVFPCRLTASSPLVVGDLVYVVTGNGVDEGHVNIPQPQAPSFIAVHKRTGKVVWQDNSPTQALLEVKAKGKARLAAINKLVDQGRLVIHGQWSSPAYAEAAGQSQVIFAGGDGWLRAFEPLTGKLIWKFNGNPQGIGQRERNHFLATPVVYENKLYVGMGYDPEYDVGVSHLWCIDLIRATRNGPKNKDRDVSPRNNNFDPKAKVNKDSALHWHFGGLLPAAQRAKSRRPFYFGRTLSTCAVADGLVYVAEQEGYLHCLDADTGQHYWQHDFKVSVWSSPYWVDGKVYLGTDDEAMFIFAHGKEKRLLKEIDMWGRVRSTPAAANGVLYIATETFLYAIAGGS